MTIAQPNFPNADPVGVPVCFLSGVMGDDVAWHWMAEYFGPIYAFRSATDADTLDAALTRPGHVVTHGTGAFAALTLAVREPWRFRSLTMIDPDVAPAIPDLLDAAVSGHAMRTSARCAAAEGDAAAAMAMATDHFAGKGAWMNSTFPVRRKLASRTGDLLTAYADQAVSPLSSMDLAGVVCPVLVVTGEHACAETHAVQHALLRHIPFATPQVVESAGYASHLADPHMVHPVMREFLVRVERQWQDVDGCVLQAA